MSVESLHCCQAMRTMSMDKSMIGKDTKQSRADRVLIKRAHRVKISKFSRIPDDRKSIRPTRLLHMSENQPQAPQSPFHKRTTSDPTQRRNSATMPSDQLSQSVCNTLGFVFGGVCLVASIVLGDFAPALQSSTDTVRTHEDPDSRNKPKLLLLAA